MIRSCGNKGLGTRLSSSSSHIVYLKARHARRESALVFGRVVSALQLETWWPRPLPARACRQPRSIATQRLYHDMYVCPPAALEPQDHGVHQFLRDFSAHIRVQFLRLTSGFRSHESILVRSVCPQLLFKRPID